MQFYPIFVDTFGKAKEIFFVKIAMWLTHALTEPVQGHDSHRQPPQTQTNTPIHD